MSLADVKKNAQDRMVKSIETLKGDLAKVRTGRAHTGILDHIQVEYYGSPTALTQVANVTLIDARTIGVQPFEKKMAATIERAIRDSDLGLNPSSQGDIIRVPIHLGERRRKIKAVRDRLEQEQGRPPSPEQVAHELDLSVQQVTDALAIATVSVSLDEPVGDGTVSRGEFVTDDRTPDPYDEIDARLDLDALVVAVERLPERERLIVESRLGLGRHQRTLEDLGRELGLTRERVRQLESRALRRLGGQMAALDGPGRQRATSASSGRR